MGAANGGDTAVRVVYHDKSEVSIVKSGVCLSYNVCEAVVVVDAATTVTKLH